MKAPTSDAVLAGNGIIATTTKPSTAFRGNVEPLHARAYHHGALADRTIVRLVQARVTSSEDSTLAVLGFTPTPKSPVVGQAKRRAIGFPAAAIAKAPELAKYALDIMRDFAREARRIKSKPGHALQGFGKLADELGRSVPAFLPSFWEEAGRAFLAAGSLDPAGQCFGKARAAEDVHHLEVDEAERHEAFLEFALAGGVTVGTLSDYAKTLEKRFAPKDAYDRFRALCRERVLGGLPPWGGMAKELARLAKNAKLDVAAEEQTLLSELIGSPALAMAPQAFWDAYKKALVALAAADPKMRGRLLDLRLKPSQAKDTFPDFWVGLLETTGAIDALVTGAPAEAQPAQGAAAAFDALLALADVSYDSAPPSTLVQVFERLAPRLIREGAPVKLFVGSWYPHWDLDLLERALALGVPLREGPDGADAEKPTFDLSDWTEHASEPGRGLDPQRVAVDPRFAEEFAVCVGNVLSEASFQTASAGKSGFVAGKRAYFRKLIDAVADGGLIAASELVTGLEDVARPGVFDDMPDIHAELAALDLVPALTRTLRAGLPDELVWPVFENAVAKLGKDAKVLGPFPHIIVGDKRTAMVLGPDGVVFTHDARLPKGAELEAARWVGGDLMVRFQKDYDGFVYWASAPTTHVECDGGSWNAENAEGLGSDLPDGGWTEGSKAIVVGDTKWPDNNRLLSDGQTLWRLAGDYQEEKTRELDPKTGTNGRESLPAFLAAHVDADHKIVPTSCTLYPVPGGERSPLGTKDGFAGWCVRVPVDAAASTRRRGNTPDAIEGIGIDGRRARGKVGKGYEPSGLLDFPGHAEPLRVGRDSGYGQSATYLEDPSGRFALATISERDDDDEDSYPWSSSTLKMMPWRAWHYLEPRDAAASKALRGVSDEVARALVTGSKAGEKIAVTEAAVRNALPINDAVLVTMIATRVRQTVALATQLGELMAGAEPSADGGGSGLTLTLEPLRDALDHLADGWGWEDGSLDAPLRVLGRALADPAAFTPSKQVNQAVLELLGQEAVLVALAASPAYAEVRDTLLDLFLALRRLGLPDAARVRFRNVDGKALVALFPAWVLVARDGALYFAPEYDEDDDEASLYEVALDGKFPSLPKVATKSGERALPRGPTWDESAAALVRERGAVAFDPQIAQVLADKTGLSIAEATLLWAGLPQLGSYDRNFLPKPVREGFGLKVDQAYIARESLEERLEDESTRLALLVAALPASPEDLYTPLGSGPDDGTSPVARLAAAWNARFGKRQKVDEGLLARAKKELGAINLPPAQAFAVFADPSSDAATNMFRDLSWSFDAYGDVEQVGDDEGFTAETLEGLVAYAAWLFLELPVGHSVRAGIPAVLAAVREHVTAPTFMLWWGKVSFEGKGWEPKVTAYFDSLGGSPLAVESHKMKARSIDLGAVRALWPGHSTVDFAVFPGRMHEDHARELMAGLAGKFTRYGSDPLEQVKVALSPELAALGARVTKTPVKDGGFEANPQSSAPKLVAQVAKALAVSKDAAAYYLQLLVVQNPSDARIMAFNGWSSAELAAAATELVDRELLVTGKRARAGREHFLPGGWVDLKAPYTPQEVWKLAFQGLEKVDGEGFQTDFGQVLWFEPVHDLFAKAWAKVEAGDGPRFEEAGAARQQKKAGKKKGA